MDFVKMEGLGNDFVVIEGSEPSEADIRRWCDRRRGVGADGVLLVGEASTPGVSLTMRYWNADGSVAEMCGNGLRCVARYGFERGMTEGSSFMIETLLGTNRAEVRPKGDVRVELGPFRVEDSIEIDGIGYNRADVGNPHAVTFVDDPETAPVLTAGPLVSSDAAFPSGTNVEFVTVEDGGLRMRVWERGVGETQACGTGAAAAVAVAASLGRTESEANVDLAGGRLRVELISGSAWITGSANVTFSGVIADCVPAAT